MASVFTRIIAGRLPCHKIHEDDLTYSFLAVPPIRLGHVLVVTKQEVDSFLDVADDAYLQVMKNARLIGRAVQRATRCRRVGTMIQGFEVAHFHYHLVPLDEPADLDFRRAAHRSGREMEEMAEKIRSLLDLGAC